ncbi:MAG: 16S rRNA (guanine(966)-N(2))-methyltransferase RsmD [Acidimicrobiales bacterium]
MRIIAGEGRGRRLVAPDGRSVRPTSDRVREAMFNALYSLGGVEEARVLDLFAGSGALGLEALSRGAASVVFVDTDAEARRCIDENLQTLGWTDRAEVIARDAWAHLERRPDPVDVAFLDPPYEFDQWPELLAAVDADRVVVESDRALPSVDGWRLDREKSYGATVVTIISRRTRPGEQAEANS